MSGSLNEATIIGNVTRDPEIRTTSGGDKVATMSVATNERWTDKNTGEKKERAEFHRVVIFNEKLAEVAEKYVRKGSKLFVRGQLQTRKWTDQSGADKYTTEVVLNRFRGELQMLDSREGAGEPTAGMAATPAPTPEAFDDDLVPF